MIEVFNISDDVKRIIEESRAEFMPVVEQAYTIGPRKWFVVYTNPKCEGKAASGIDQKFRSYLPKETDWRKRSRKAKHQKAKKVRISKPLFTRYVMIELPVSDKGIPFGVVREIDGVREFISTFDGPTQVKLKDVDKVRDREASGEFDNTVKKGRIFIPHWALTENKCRVVDGPFASFEATILEFAPNERLKVSVNIFGRETVVDLELEQVERL